MIEDDPFARLKKTEGPKLEDMGIAELEARIESLKGEIDACEAMIRLKRAKRADADALFGRRDG